MNEPFDESGWAAVPPGYKPGETPGATTWRTSVCLIFPPVAKPHHAQIAATVREWTSSNGHRFVAIRSKLSRARNGLPYSVLQATHAKGLYRSAHRERVYVIALASARVLLDPTELPSTEGTVPIQAYVRYKCGFSTVARPSDLPPVLTMIETYFHDCQCDGIGDPRCIPFSLFQRRDNNANLDDGSQRSAFAEIHRSSKTGRAVLIDRRHTHWQHLEFHGRDLIEVAGRGLPIGFHWNVNGAGIFVNGWERWKVMPGGYINVQPDAKIRVGARSTRQFQVGRSADQGAPRTPATIRRSRARK